MINSKVGDGNWICDVSLGSLNFIIKLYLYLIIEISIVYIFFVVMVIYKFLVFFFWDDFWFWSCFNEFSIIFMNNCVVVIFVNNWFVSFLKFFN